MQKLIVAGCSYSTPEGDLPTCWPELLADEYSVINLSQPAGSNDRIYRVLHELNEREAITPDDVIIIQHTSPTRWEIVAHPSDLKVETNFNREHTDYGVHLKFKPNSYKWNFEPHVSEYMHTTEQYYLNIDYQRRYYARRHREFKAYAREQGWCLYHMWAAEYSEYMRTSEDYDRVIDVSWVTDTVDNCLSVDDTAHLSIRGHHTVADTVKATIKKT